MDRLNAIQNIRSRLKQGGVSIGSWIQIPHPSIAEILGQAGYDWVAVDMEHGSIAVNQLPDLFRALELGNTLPLARIAHAHSKDCKQALDAGAGGIIVPMIESAEQLLHVRNACCWPPAGNRGVAYSRANLFGRNFESYYKEAQAPLLIAMIEHYQAVNKLEEIFSVEGLDAILIGPYDLSASMGITEQFKNPEFCSVMKIINDKAKEYGIPSGIHVVAPSEFELKMRINDGYSFIAYSIDAVMFNSVVNNPVYNSKTS
jgi:2-dehydro-3-deoxyglucarate aldolase